MGKCDRELCFMEGPMIEDMEMSRTNPIGFVTRKPSPLLCGVSKMHNKRMLVCGLCTGRGQSCVGKTNQLGYFK